ncbi:hypothetical protein MNBD_NITROSPINAE03-414 [hydrothermal vent metagenome]|uniref:Cyclic nucleotide-binding domain-containing protein n=1 Tax=hydrothermal vent metagenome TaxID=652676 RepID=A0A3B1BVG2_9ZZZZ
MKFEGADKEKWISLLKGVKFFSGFNIDDLNYILDAGNVSHYKYNDYVLKEDEVDFSFCVILKGKVRIVKRNVLKQKKEVGRIEAGACFGEMGLLLKQARTASVIAGEECFIFKLRVYEIDSMPSTTKAKLYQKFAEELAVKLEDTTKAMVDPSL